MSNAAEQLGRSGKSGVLTEVRIAFAGWDISEEDQVWLEGQLDGKRKEWDTLFATPAAQLEGIEIFDPVWR